MCGSVSLHFVPDNGRELDAPLDDSNNLLDQPNSTKCAGEGEYCMRRPCCEGSGTKCYKKDSFWASCKKECEPGIDKNDPKSARTPWSCEELVPARDRIGEETLFCFALMLPESYEVGLLQSQLDRGLGIFACDASAVYSNVSVKFSSKVPMETEIVEGSLYCELGGQYMTALNTEIFVRVWKKVLSGKEYSINGWTVKADPDAVILPHRLSLRARRSKFLQGRQAKVYVNNCQFGLHGPVEMLSREAMSAYKDGIDRCVEELRGEFGMFGEDVFLRECLSSLGVSSVDDFSMMKEAHCDWHGKTDQEVMPCTRGRAAYHPLKTEELWHQCHDEAMAEEPGTTTLTITGSETTVSITPISTVTTTGTTTTPRPTTTAKASTSSTAAKKNVDAQKKQKHAHHDSGKKKSKTQEQDLDGVPWMISAVVKSRIESCADYAGVPHHDNVTCCPGACGNHCGATDCHKWGDCCGSALPVQLCNSSKKAPCTLSSALAGKGADVMRDRSAHDKARSSSTSSNGTSSWACHRYEKNQDVEWCKTVRSEGGVEYRLFGPQSPCDFCWCCKRPLQNSTKHLAPGENSDPAALAKNWSGPSASSYPFNCDVGFDHWKDGWSSSKKTWCCENFQVGCEASTTTLRASPDRTSEEEPRTWRDMWTGLVWDTVPPDEDGDTHYEAQFTASGGDDNGTLKIEKEGGFFGEGTFNYNHIDINNMTAHWVQDGDQTKLVWSSMFTWTRGRHAKRLPREASVVQDAVSEVVIATTREPAKKAHGKTTTSSKQTTSSPATATAPKHTTSTLVTTTTQAKWACHHYTGIAGRKHCETAGVENGVEYKFFGLGSPCGATCWCCKRPAQANSSTTTTAAAAAKAKSEKHKGLKTISAAVIVSVEPSMTATTVTSTATETATTTGVTGTGTGTTTTGVSETTTATTIRTHTSITSVTSITSTTVAPTSVASVTSITTVSTVAPTSVTSVTSITTVTNGREVTTVADASTQAPETTQEKQASDWQCVFYDWKTGGSCPDGAFENGFEYRFFGEETPCAPCWCCKKESAEAPPPPLDLLPEPQQATGPWRLTHIGAGCSNWVELQIGDKVWPLTVDECAQRCDETDGCVTFNVQRGDRTTCSDGGSHKGSCMLFSADCDKMDNPCWDYYTRHSDMAQEGGGRGEDEGGADWMCHEYDEEAGNADGAEWCRQKQEQGVVDGLEYRYFGPDSPASCNSCWCCKRPRSEEPPQETEELVDPAVMMSVAPAPESCEQYGGIPHFDQVTCCDQSCGEHCGATDCEEHGEDLCCGGGIPDEQVCAPGRPAPCTMSSALKSMQAANGL
jgi:hypothetical protein